MEYIIVDIKKPLFDYENVDFVYIRNKYIKEAKRKNLYLKIITPKGTHYTTPQDWMKGCKKIEKVFKFPDRPMKLVGNYAIPNDPPEMADISKDHYLENMCRLGDVFRKKILKKRGY